MRLLDLSEQIVWIYICIFVQICNNVIMNDQEVQRVADLLKALGEFNRLSLVYELCQCRDPQKLCVCVAVAASRCLPPLKSPKARRGRHVGTKWPRTELFIEQRVCGQQLAPFG